MVKNIPNPYKITIAFILFVSFELFAQNNKLISDYTNLIEIYNQLETKIATDTEYIKTLSSKKHVLNSTDISYLKKFGLQVYNGITQFEQFENTYENSEENALYLLSSVIYKLKLISNTFNLLKTSPKLYILIDDGLKRKGYKRKSFYKLIKRNISNRELYKVNNQIIYFLEDLRGKFRDVKYKNLVMEILGNIYSYNNININLSNNENILFYKTTLKQKRKVIRKYNIKRFTDASQNSLSKIFGNFIGIFALRKGKLYQSKSFSNDLLMSLEPLDLLIEKSQFRLTDNFIPGYWGHVAIYIGNENQLKDLGLWEETIVIKYHNQIHEGATIVEALRTDVQINSLEHFSNIDDFAHLRYNKELSTFEKKELILKTIEQIGKKYDFNFNIENDETVVCTELPYDIFNMVKWNATKTFGRYTLSVDEIAKHGKTGGSFTLKNLYLGGKKVDKEKRHGIFDSIDRMSKKEIRKIKKSLKTQ